MPAPAEASGGAGSAPCWCDRLSASLPVWVVPYKEQPGEGGTHLNSKDEEFLMVNISEWLTWQGRVPSGEAEKLGAGWGGLSVYT